VYAFITYGAVRSQDAPGLDFAPPLPLLFEETFQEVRARGVGGCWDGLRHRLRGRRGAEGFVEGRVCFRPIKVFRDPPEFL